MTDAAGGEVRTCPSCGEPASDATFRFCTSCGARLDQDGPGGALVPLVVDDEAESPRWWGRHRRLLLLVTAGLSAVLVAGFLAWQWSGVRQAEGPVAAFFAALADGDGPAAAALLGEALISDGQGSGHDPTIGGAVEGALDSPIWAEGALSSGYTAPTDVELEVDYGAAEGVERRDDRSYARVTAAYTVAGSRFEQEFRLERVGGGWSREWQIIGVLLDELQPVGSSTTAQIANAAPTLGGIVVPPGEYAVAIEGSALFEDATGRAVVGGDTIWNPGSGTNRSPFNNSFRADVTVELEDLTLRDSVQGEVERQVAELIDACAAPHGLDWEACPFQLVSDSSVVHYIASALEAGSQWEVEAYPEVEAVVDGAKACLRLVEEGRAVGEQIDPADGSLALKIPGSSYEARLAATGIITMREGEMTWLPDVPC